MQKNDMNECAVFCCRGDLLTANKYINEMSKKVSNVFLDKGGRIL